MEYEPTGSRPCHRGECERHHHPPCNQGWISVDRVCPCWSARRRLVVNHSGPPDQAPPAPMPASIRAAWNTARADARPLPQSGPSRRPDPASSPPPVPGPLDPRGAEVVSRLSLDPAPAGPLLRRLVGAVAAALDQGWTVEDLVQLLDADRDPDREPVRYWIWRLGWIGPALDAR